MTRCAALILAGGTGSRIGANTPKQYLYLGERSILRRTLDIFENHPRIDIVRTVIGPNDEEFYENSAGDLDAPAPVIGGRTRQESGLNGLEALLHDAPDFVLIHDAVRPFVDPTTIDRVIDALELAPVVLPAIAVADTLKRCFGDPPVVNQTIERAGLWRAQTPQGFRYHDILKAHRAAVQTPLTDDAAVAENAGLPVTLVQGNEENFKITTTEDLKRAEQMTDISLGDIRIGTGFDVHALSDGDHVVLCGIRIDHARGVEGHSDADVAMHAVTDALLGAIAEGDIGSHFPPSDARWEDAASSVFLQHASDLISKRGGRVGNIDLTIICEAPKIDPHRDAMAESLAQILCIDVKRISVKATTTEKLGFSGRGEGIAAQASAIIRLP